MPYLLCKLSSMGSAKINEYCQLLVRKFHLDANRVDPYTGFVLHNLVRNMSDKAERALDFLLDSGINADIKASSAFGACTALQLAIYKGQWQAAILLGNLLMFDDTINRAVAN